MKKLFLGLILLGFSNSVGAQQTSINPKGGGNGPLIAPLLLIGDGSTTNPTIANSASTNTGIYFPGSNQVGIVANGVATATFAGGASPGMTLASNAYFGISSDVFLLRDAAQVFAQRNSTNAQTFRIYNTYTDASNYERASLGWASNVFTIGTEMLGTGTARNIAINAANGALGLLQVNGTSSLIWGNTSVTPGTTDTFDLGGVSGNNYWRSVHVSRGIQGSKSKTVTDAAAAVAFTRVAVPNNGYAGGELIWDTSSTDATDYRSTTGRIRFAGVNKAGTVTCAVNVVGTDLTASSNANTLVCTWTNVVSTTNCDLSVTCTDNTAGSQTINVNGRLDMPIPNTVTPQ